MPQTQRDGKQRYLAWNGLRASLPDAWRPAGLGLRYLLLEDDDGPAFEYKWRPGAGREGMEAALRALTPKRRARTGVDLPSAWLDALTEYELMPLTWARDGRSGLGAALFHPETGTAAVFQAYGGPDGPDAGRLAQTAAVLSSLSFDPPQAPSFSIYGLSLTAPEGFALATFSFDPGRFVLEFAGPRQRLDLVRLAPASVLFSRQGAEAWTRQALGFAPEVPVVAQPLAGAPAWWVALRQGQGPTDRLARWCGRRGRLGVLRQDLASDKLLGAVATGVAPIDRNWLAGVVTGCVSL
jgi:hypothetical protein